MASSLGLCLYVAIPAFVSGHFRLFFFFSSRRRHTRYIGDWSSDVCSSDLFSVEAFSCQKAGNARSEYEDAWAIRGSDSPTRCRLAVADGATESSFSALWAALLVESFVRGRAHGPEFFKNLGAIRRLWRRKIRGRPLPWYAAEKARRGAYAAFVGASLNVVNRGWRAVAIGDCCLLHVTGAPASRELANAFPL